MAHLNVCKSSPGPASSILTSIIEALHIGQAGRLNWSEWNDGRQALRLGHDASLERGGSTTLSVTGNA